MITRMTVGLVAALLLLAPVASHASLASYTQDFETLVISDPNALATDGWVVYGNVFTSTGTYIYGYGVFPAPNVGNAFCSIAANQGGLEQGAQQLSIFSDYENTDHAVGHLIESNVFREQTIGALDVNNTWTFRFDAKLGNLLPPSTAVAFLKTIDPAQGYAQTNYFPVAMTAIPATWANYSVSITIDPALVGQLLQFGFSSTATTYQSSGVYYDNLSWTQTGSVGVEDSEGLRALRLSPAAPNPFRTSTRLDFTLPVRGLADISVYDVGGRRVANLFHAEADAGPHAAAWDGRSSDGRVAPAGVYHAVLKTATGSVTRNLILTH